MGGSKERFYCDLTASNQEVTGSCFQGNISFPDGTKTMFLVDFGTFQEQEYVEFNKIIPFDSSKVKFVLLTHNHMDHIGRLPMLIKDGFKSTIYSTCATKILAPYALHDSYKILKKDAKKNHTKELFSENHVNAACELFKGCEYGTTIQIDDRIRATFFKNGHLIGSAIILVQISYPGFEDINLLFSGDYNNKNMFFDVPDLPEWVLNLPLTLIMESTYGTTNSTDENMSGKFEENVIASMQKGAMALALVFSLGRTQEILYTLKNMQDRGRLPKYIPIYFDGKLAQSYTNLYLTEKKLEIREDMRNFMPENVIWTDKTMRSSVIEDRSQKIIVATSGMGSYGPAKQYIPKLITRKNCLIQFTGYVAEGTLGNRLKSTEIGSSVEIEKVLYKKLADVQYTTEFSGHAKADEMIAFLKKFKNLKLVLVNHGQTETKFKFSERIEEEVKPKHTAIAGRDYLFRVSPYGLVKSMSAKLPQVKKPKKDKKDEKNKENLD